MIIKEAIREGINRLKPHSGTTWLEANVILSYVIGKDRTYLVSHDDEVLSSSEVDRFFEYIDMRLGGIPLQYITGVQEFMSIDFAVNPSVLIPRQDTEILVEEVIGKVVNLNNKNRIEIIDVGTGSGCIAVSIAAAVKNVFVTAVDISDAALETAQRNAKTAGVLDRIEFIKSSLFEKIGRREFDVIVSNPPYIPSKVINTLQVEVKEHEPLQALDGGEDGLDYYRKITDEAVLFLKNQGLLAFEIGYDQAAQVSNIICETKKFTDIKIIKDLAGNDRVVTAILKPM